MLVMMTTYGIFVQEESYVKQLGLRELQPSDSCDLSETLRAFRRREEKGKKSRVLAIVKVSFLSFVGEE